MQRKKTILGISLIHGRFHALAMVKGEVTHSWVCPHPVSTPEEFRAALKEAVQVTTFPGRRISVLMETDQTVHHYYLVPPMKRADLTLYLDRMAEEEKGCEGPVMWRSRTAAAGRGRTGVLMDVWPKSAVDDLVEVCEGMNLTLVQMFPLSAVFVDQVRTLGVEPEDVILLVSIVAGKILFVVATGDGKPIFDRFLSAGSGDQPDVERIVREIIRSILFANQQLGVQVGQVWVLGEQDGISAEQLQSRMKVPVFFSPIVPDAAYWIWTGMMLPLNHASNFITAEVRRAPLRKMLLKTAMALMVGMAGLSVSTTGLVEALVAREQGVTVGFREQVRQHQVRKQEWQQRYTRVASQRKWAQTILTDGTAPVAEWFVQDVARVLPGAVILTRVNVQRDGDGWAVELEGSGPMDSDAYVEVLMQLEEALASGPFQVRITNSWRKRWREQLQQGGPDQGSHRTKRFVMEGRIS